MFRNHEFQLQTGIAEIISGHFIIYIPVYHIIKRYTDQKFSILRAGIYRGNITCLPGTIAYGIKTEHIALLPEMNIAREHLPRYRQVG